MPCNLLFQQRIHEPAGGGRLLLDHRVILNVPEPEKNVELAMILFPFYSAFMAGDLLTSVMYGLGLTK